MPDHHRSSLLALGAGLVIATIAAPAARAQYPLAPGVVLDTAKLARQPAFSGYVAVRGTRPLPVDSTEAWTFGIQRAVLAAEGLAGHGLAYKVQVDFARPGKVAADSAVSSFALSDAFIQLPSRRWGALDATLVAGQFKQPFSLEYLTSFARLITADRSLAVDALSYKRDIGLMGALALGHAVRLDAAVTNGSGADTPENPDGSNLGTARLTVVPVHGLALAAKAGLQRNDFRWGYDARWIAPHLIGEGEVILRKVSATGGKPGRAASGGYALLGIPVHGLIPHVKWEQLRESVLAVDTRATQVTAGISGGHDFRVQLEWQQRTDRPTGVRSDAVVLQAFAIF